MPVLPTGAEPVGKLLLDTGPVGNAAVPLPSGEMAPEPACPSGVPGLLANAGAVAFTASPLPAPESQNNCLQQPHLMTYLLPERIVMPFFW